MRICYVSDGIPPHCGGAPLRALRYAQRFRTNYDLETTLIAWDRYQNGSNPNPLPPYVHRVKLRFQETDGSKSIAGFVSIILRLVELTTRLGILLFALRREFDVLHIINAASLFGLVTVPIAKLLNKRIILETVGLGGDDPVTLNKRSTNPHQQFFPHQPIKFSLFLHADAYVSKSPALTATYHEAGLSDLDIHEIPNGVNVSKFKPPTQDAKKELRKKLGLRDQDVVILFVGVLCKNKGVHHLIEAFGKIAPRSAHAKVLLVGPALPQNMEYLSALRRNIMQLELDERVTIVDEMVDNTDEYMQASDIFCLPTQREGFPGVVIEAMASGLPVVVSRLDGITTNIVQSDKEGILVPYGNTKVLASALLELIDDVDLRIRLGQAARRRVIDDFSDQAIDDRYIQLYKRVLSGEEHNPVPLGA